MIFLHIELNQEKTDDIEKGNADPTTDKKKRRVSFADAIGEELAHVKVFEEPEYQVPLKVKEPEQELDNLELTFPLPAVDSEIFSSRYEKNHVILEKLNLGTVNIAGRIRISASSDGAERKVAVRYTKDGWMSFTKQPARFIQTVSSLKNTVDSKKEKKKGITSSPGCYDLYCFEIGVDRQIKTVQFLISSCDSQGKPEFEDNNDGECYTVFKSKLPRTKRRRE